MKILTTNGDKMTTEAELKEQVIYLHEALIQAEIERDELKLKLEEVNKDLRRKERVIDLKSTEQKEMSKKIKQLESK